MFVYTECVRNEIGNIEIKIVLGSKKPLIFKAILSSVFYHSRMGFKRPLVQSKRSITARK